MAQMKKSCAAVFTLAVLVVAALGSEALALDCVQTRVELKKERNVLKRRKLVEAGLEKCPDDAFFHYQYGYNLERLRKYSEALKYYMSASHLDPEFAKAYFGMGDIHMILGDPGAAVNDYEKGLLFDPASARVQHALQIARIKNKSQSGAEISSDEFATVMQEDLQNSTEPQSVEGPLLRMQIQFDSNSANLSPVAANTLNNVVGKAMVSDTLGQARFEVIGHTDGTGDPEQNLLLSKLRAEAVRNYLVQKFAINPVRLLVSYYGEAKPAVPNTSHENLQVNRRVEFRRVE